MTDIIQDIVPTKEVLQEISPELAWQYHIFPVKRDADSYHFVIDETASIQEIKNELKVLLGTKIELVPREREEVIKVLNKYYLKEKKRNGNVSFSLNDSEDFVDRIIVDANELNSSDIHIEKYEGKCRIRFRIDGTLVERYSIKPAEFPAIINKIKIKASLDISEKRLPQDGRINFQMDDIKFDIRVSSLPTLHGEKIVLRILGSDASHLRLDDLGFSLSELDVYRENIKKPSGIILISGPTGSGKTTTLYSTLKELNLESKNILTIEDPVEYTLAGINQVQLKESIGLDFGKALRTFLRQDPDIIMVGEIRDPDTANMAIRAALTGHLVLSTIHTNSAWGTISRLIDMGIPPYLLSSTLNLSVAQRLVRKLCNNCKRTVPFSTELVPENYRNLVSTTTQEISQGCDECFHTGFQGRMALYEIIPINQFFAEKIKDVELNVEQDLKRFKVETLATRSISLFQKGITSFDEIYPLLIQN